MLKNDFKVANWLVPKHIKTLITTKYGGVSKANFANFNLATHVNDNLHDVITNRQILRQFIPSEPLWLKQSHTNKVYTVKSNTINLLENEEFDAIIDHKASSVCAILTADCLPILLTNTNGDFISAIHAGWAGLYTNILDNTIKQINSPSHDILVYIGPSICSKCFIVKDDLWDKFSQLNLIYRKFFQPISIGTWQCDLAAIATLQLINHGIAKHNIYLANECTCCNPQLYYSYRHSAITGRIASLIWREE